MKDRTLRYKKYMDQYYIDHRDTILERNREYKRNPEQNKERVKLWRQNKKEESYNNMSIQEKNKQQAIAIMRFFMSRIKSGEFVVNSAGWWKDNMGTGASMKIDIDAISDDSFDLVEEDS